MLYLELTGDLSSSSTLESQQTQQGDDRLQIQTWQTPDNNRKNFLGLGLRAVNRVYWKEAFTFPSASREIGQCVFEILKQIHKL